MRNSDFGLDEMTFLNRGEQRNAPEKKSAISPLSAHEELKTEPAPEPTAEHTAKVF